jgi:hypothetical protein
MIIKCPPKSVIKKFYRICELNGSQKAINYLSHYYNIRRMKLVVNGRCVGNGAVACYDYDDCTAFFTKRGFTTRNVLHEFYHHLIGQIVLKYDERDADRYARQMS